MLQNKTNININENTDSSIIEGAIIDIDYNKIASPPIKEDTFGQRLRKSRLELNLSLLEVADLCGVTRSVIDGYELGRFYPSKEVLFKLSNYFDLDYLTRDGYTKLLYEHDKFIKRLKEWIEENNLTKQEAADRIGISRGLLRFWFNGSVVRSNTYFDIKDNLEKYNLL